MPGSVYVPYEPNYGSSPVRIDKTAEAPQYYYFQTLTKENQIHFYKELEKMAASYGDAVVPTRKITFDEAFFVYQLFMFDHPEVFWLGYEISYNVLGDSIVSFRVSRTYTVQEARDMQVEIDAVCDEIIASIPDDAVDIEAELAIYMWLTANVTYDSSDTDCYTLYGSLVERKSVCEGYSEAFQYICGKIGIVATSISGVTNNGEPGTGHKWNAVNIGGKWYQVDPTWSSMTSNNYTLYFNNSAYIASTRTIDDELLDLLPDFTATDAEYLHYYGLVVDPSAEPGSVFSFENVLLRSVVHYKTTLTSESKYNLGYIYAPDEETAAACAAAIKNKTPETVLAFKAASLGDGYRYVTYGAGTDLNVVHYNFYRQ